MRSQVVNGLSLLMVTLLLGVVVWFTIVFVNQNKNTTGLTNKDGYTIPRLLRYSFTLKNTSNQLLKDVEFWSHAPVKQTASQRCCEQLQASVPFTLEEDPLGNQLLHFKIAEIAPFANKIVQVSAELRLASTAQATPLMDEKMYIGEAPFVEVNHSKIKALAGSLQGKQTQDVAQRTYDWVSRNVRYTGYQSKDRGALYALSTASGDCTEFMHLFMALARNKGIPTRGVAGYVYDRDAVLRPRDHHNWAEFYDQGVWHLVDAQRRVFDTNANHYIAMRILGGDQKKGVSNVQRYWHQQEGLEIRMN